MGLFLSFWLLCHDWFLEGFQEGLSEGLEVGKRELDPLLRVHKLDLFPLIEVEMLVKVFEMHLGRAHELLLGD